MGVHSEKSFNIFWRVIVGNAQIWYGINLCGRSLATASHWPAPCWGRLSCLTCWSCSCWWCWCFFCWSCSCCWCLCCTISSPAQRTSIWPWQASPKNFQPKEALRSHLIIPLAREHHIPAAWLTLSNDQNYLSCWTRWQPHHQASEFQAKYKMWASLKLLLCWLCSFLLSCVQ